ncbi:hypothetical protein [Thermogemmatispora sp.]|uniref:hypothetical protein n=1 Tax=Thermogemmatispora sp. TaxID=1968838 RepID=UPI0035E4377B
MKLRRSKNIVGSVYIYEDLALAEAVVERKRKGVLAAEDGLTAGEASDWGSEPAAGAGSSRTGPERQ